MVHGLRVHGPSIHLTVPGCLIVEIRDHTPVEKAKNGQQASQADPLAIPYSLHNFNDHVTPSALGIRTHEDQSKPKPVPDHDPKDDKPQADNKPEAQVKSITTVLHPTTQSRHAEMIMLACTPVNEAKAANKKAALREATTMILQPGSYHAFEAAMLLATEGPLLLEPAETIEEAQAALDKLQHPLHSRPYRTAQTRKRTHAEMAADDAQAAREEHQMLVMDDRLTAGRGAGSLATETQTGTAGLSFTRFKTLETIKQKHEDDERERKEKEARAAMEKRQADLAAAQRRMAAEQQQQRRNTQDAQTKRLVMQQQQALHQQQVQQAQVQQNKQQQIQQQAFQGQSQQGSQPNSAVFPPSSMAQSSPLMRQQTPLVASSPLVSANVGLPGGPPMQAALSNQGAGSPARPSSTAPMAATAMGIQMSQQQSQSRQSTPQLQNVTPHPPSSLSRNSNGVNITAGQMAQGSPLAMNAQTMPNVQNMQAGGVNVSQMTPQQRMFIAQQQQQRQKMLQAGMSPEQINQYMQQQMQRMQQNPQAMMNPQAYQARLQQLQRAQLQQRMAQQAGHLPQGNQQQGSQQMQQQMSQQQQAGQQTGQQLQNQAQQRPGGIPMASNPSQAQQMAQLQAGQAAMGLANNNPQLAAQQQQQQQRMRQAAALRQQQLVQQIAAQHGGTIPPHIRQQLMQQQQQQQQQAQQQQQMRNYAVQQQAALRAQQNQQNGGLGGYAKHRAVHAESARAAGHASARRWTTAGAATTGCHDTAAGTAIYGPATGATTATTTTGARVPEWASRSSRSGWDGRHGIEPGAAAAAVCAYESCGCHGATAATAAAATTAAAAAAGRRHGRIRYASCVESTGWAVLRLAGKRYRGISPCGDQKTRTKLWDSGWVILERAAFPMMIPFSLICISFLFYNIDASCAYPGLV